MKSTLNKILCWTQVILLSGIIQMPVTLAARPVKKTENGKKETTQTIKRTDQIGKVSVIKGRAQKISITGRATLLKQGDPVFIGDTIASNSEGGVKVVLNDKSELILGAASRVLINKTPQDQPQLFTVLYGQLRAKVTKSPEEKVKMLIKTPTATIAVKGTDVQAVYNPQTGNTSTVTLEGNVAVAKYTPPATPPISTTEATALSQVGQAVALSAPRAIPAPALNTLSQATAAVEKAVGVANLSAADRTAINTVNNYTSTAVAAGGAAPVTPEVAQAIQKVSDLRAQIPPPAVTMTPAQIAEAAKAAETVSANVTSAQQSQMAPVLNEIRDLAAKTSTGGDAAPVTLNAQQIVAMTQLPSVAQAVTAESKPAMTPAEAAPIQKLTQIVSQNVDPAKMTPAQTAAVAQVQQLATQATQTGRPAPLTPEATQALATVQNMARTNIAPASLPPEQRQVLTQANQAIVTTVSTPKPVVPAEIVNAVAPIAPVAQSVSQQASTPPAGLTRTDVQALGQLTTASNYVAPVANPPKISADAVTAVANMVTTNVSAAQMTPQEQQALQTVQQFATQATEQGAAITPPPNVVAAMATVGQIAVQGAGVAAATPPKMTEVVATLSDPTKSVQVSAGQFSGVSPAVERPTEAVKIAPAQIATLQASSAIDTATPARAAPTTAVAAATTISPIPPGVNAKSVMPTAADAVKMMDQTMTAIGATPGAAGAGITGPGGPTTPGLAAPTDVAGGPISSAPTLGGTASAGLSNPQGLNSPLGPPPEGFFDASTGKMAPPAGGFVDLKTGVYVPPPPGSAFDSVAQVYVPPPSMGSFSATTGEYVPPAGFQMSAAGSLVAAPKTPMPGAVTTGGLTGLAGASGPGGPGGPGTTAAGLAAPGASMAGMPTAGTAAEFAPPISAPGMGAASSMHFADPATALLATTTGTYDMPAAPRTGPGASVGSPGAAGPGGPGSPSSPGMFSAPTAASTSGVGGLQSAGNMMMGSAYSPTMANGAATAMAGAAILTGTTRPEQAWQGAAMAAGAVGPTGPGMAASMAMPTMSPGTAGPGVAMTGTPRPDLAYSQGTIGAAMAPPVDLSYLGPQGTMKPPGAVDLSYLGPQGTMPTMSSGAAPAPGTAMLGSGSMGMGPSPTFGAGYAAGMSSVAPGAGLMGPSGPMGAPTAGMPSAGPGSMFMGMSAATFGSGMVAAPPPPGTTAMNMTAMASSPYMPPPATMAYVSAATPMPGTPGAPGMTGNMSGMNKDGIYMAGMTMPQGMGADYMAGMTGMMGMYGGMTGMYAPGTGPYPYMSGTQPMYPTYNPYLCPPYCNPQSQPGTTGTATTTTISTTSVTFTIN